mmetsp:Transcript_2906/g.4257  ORF Transcript_2906/g.4257 Transcript_2906/m.4257 type:complete len:192 (+) Transcript_2906:89-664(+)|eukprot:CAMPEP_0167744750 /NCGR_PEP_ID=MMETSP0110_2-20121227/2763_1 /TAXON_ID=629695 /ORGANISM="Gymnochlora sp., Strain CCMP2014" /LENGTH=191 /DNA_ID=CAMNT_0007629303 /DNA_START=26 /DNA_END=601 /DNA_ORIENTATION=+
MAAEGFWMAALLLAFANVDVRLRFVGKKDLPTKKMRLKNYFLSKNRLRGGCYDDQPDTLGVFTMHDLGSYGWKEEWMLDDNQAYMEVYMFLDDEVTLKDCNVVYRPFQLSVQIRGEDVLNGTLSARIDPQLCCHEIDIPTGRRVKNSRFDGRRCLVIHLAKFHWTVWKKLFVGERESKSFEQELDEPNKYE